VTSGEGYFLGAQNGPANERKQIRKFKFMNELFKERKQHSKHEEHNICFSNYLIVEVW
jgi:hypothetical protein